MAGMNRLPTQTSKNADALIAAIPDTPNAGTSNDFADVVNAVNSNSYAEGAINILWFLQVKA